MELIDFSDDIVPLNVGLLESVSGAPKVLAKFSGTFFVPDGASRNKRWYPESLWRKTLESQPVQKALQDGMIGTLLHPTDEKMAHPMYASHVVKSLAITEDVDEARGKVRKTGRGEAFILDTPIGRIVETFQRSGLVSLYVSSRAYGKYKKDEKHQGMPVVDENNYVLKTFDLVMEPGFLEAKPQFGEQLEQLAECYLSHINDLRLKKPERESRARKLIRDMDLVLARL